MEEVTNKMIPIGNNSECVWNPENPIIGILTISIPNMIFCILLFNFDPLICKSIYLRIYPSIPNIRVIIMQNGNVFFNT